MQDNERANVLRDNLKISDEKPPKPEDFKPIRVGSGQGSQSLRTYTVNVMSAGPDKEFDTYDDIWSWPDDFE